MTQPGRVRPFERLLAKSPSRDVDAAPPPTLRKHTAMVLAAADALLDVRGAASLRAVGLPLDWEPRLRRVVRLGAFVHDLGKCSDHFQRMLRGSREPQLVRHEALSAWLARPGGLLGAWLEAAVEERRELDVAVMAAAGHHRKFSLDLESRDAGPLTLLLSHADFASTCTLGHKLGLSPPPVLADEVIEHIKEVRKAVVAWDVGRDRLGGKWQLLLAVAKALVIAADVAGSALPAAGAGERKPAWIRDELTRTDPEAAARVVTQRLGGDDLRPFQRRVRDSDAPVVLVQAGCGGGKTIAAYAWAAKQHPGRRLWVTYPTTGTTTEGYLGYLQEANVRGRLEHGRASVDVEIFDVDERWSRAPDDDEELRRSARALDRLDALRHWGADVVTCTIDTVLGLLADQRRGLYAWPSLCDAAVVFDEIHAYDERLFGLLLRFLRDLPGVPALLMTASLPRARRQALEQVVSSVHERTLAVVEGEKDLETLARYTIERRDVPPDDEVERALEADKKVLWVCNTVNRALSTAQRLERLSPLVYHSRFRYIDRVERHRDVVDAFGRYGRAFAVTTQVCEMSLDLSADLLVTDLAPIPALIQRLGRLNRRSTPEKPKPVRPCLVLPFSGRPYERGLQEAEAWLARLGTGELGQRDLVRAWEVDDTSDTQREKEQAIWIDGVMKTEPESCRKASPGLSVLRECDAKDVKRGRCRVTEVVLPMPRPPRGLAGKWQHWERENGIPVAPPDTIDYDQHLGGRWRDPEGP